MAKYYVNKTQWGFQWKQDGSNSSGWVNMPERIKTLADIKGYFESGGHCNGRGKYNTPELTFTDADLKPVFHYEVRPADPFISAVVNYDPKKKLLFGEIMGKYGYRRVK